MFLHKNWQVITNNYVAFNIDKVLPNTGSIANYLLSAIFSFGSLVSFILDIADNEFDGFYSVKIS